MAQNLDSAETEIDPRWKIADKQLLEEAFESEEFDRVEELLFVSWTDVCGEDLSVAGLRATSQVKKLLDQPFELLREPLEDHLKWIFARQLYPPLQQKKKGEDGEADSDALEAATPTAELLVLFGALRDEFLRADEVEHYLEGRAKFGWVLRQVLLHLAEKRIFVPWFSSTRNRVVSGGSSPDYYQQALFAFRKAIENYTYDPRIRDWKPYLDSVVFHSMLSDADAEKQRVDIDSPLVAALVATDPDESRERDPRIDRHVALAVQLAISCEVETFVLFAKSHLIDVRYGNEIRRRRATTGQPRKVLEEIGSLTLGEAQSLVLAELSHKYSMTETEEKEIRGILDDKLARRESCDESMTIVEYLDSRSEEPSDRRRENLISSDTSRVQNILEKAFLAGENKKHVIGMLKERELQVAVTAARFLYGGGNKVDEISLAQLRSRINRNLLKERLDIVLGAIFPEEGDSRTKTARKPMRSEWRNDVFRVFEAQLLRLPVSHRDDVLESFIKRDPDFFDKVHRLVSAAAWTREVLKNVTKQRSPLVSVPVLFGYARSLLRSEESFDVEFEDFVSDRSFEDCLKLVKESLRKLLGMSRGSLNEILDPIYPDLPSLLSEVRSPKDPRRTLGQEYPEIQKRRLRDLRLNELENYDRVVEEINRLLGQLKIFLQ